MKMIEAIEEEKRSSFKVVEEKTNKKSEKNQDIPLKKKQWKSRKNNQQVEEMIQDLKTINSPTISSVIGCEFSLLRWNSEARRLIKVFLKAFCPDLLIPQLKALKKILRSVGTGAHINWERGKAFEKTEGIKFILKIFWRSLKLIIEVLAPRIKWVYDFLVSSQQNLGERVVWFLELIKILIPGTVFKYSSVTNANYR